MSCTSLGFRGQVVERKNPVLVQGSDYFLVVQMIYADSLVPYAFDTFVGATGTFGNTDSTTTTVVVGTSATSQDRALGKVRFDLAATATADLAEGEEQSFQVDFEDALGLTKIILEGKLWVSAELF